MAHGLQVADVAAQLRSGYRFGRPDGTAGPIIKWSVTFKTYPGGHSLGNKAELEAAVRWWLTSPAKGR